MSVRIFYIYLILSIFFLTSCSREEQEVMQARPVSEKETPAPAGKTGRTEADDAAYSLTLIPRIAYRNSVLRVTSNRVKLPEDGIRWLRNGKTVEGESGIQFSPLKVVKGDTIEAAAQVDNKEMFSNAVTIRNSPPRITGFREDSGGYVTGDPLEVDAEWKDIDGDDVEITYEWTRNGEPVGSGRRIEGTFKRGDRLVITITPFDGEDYGRPAVLNRVIQNMSPKIEQDLTYDFDGKVFTSQVRAVDPDGDTLSYQLDSAREGVKIGPATGLITWNVPEGFLGDVPVTVSVTDGHGGESSRELILTIAEEN